MKPFRMLSRGIRDAFKSVFRNFSLSSASIIAITITLLVMSVALIISANVNYFAENIIKDVTVVAYLDFDIADNELEDLKNEFMLLDNVESIEVVTKEQAALEMSTESVVMTEIFAQYEEGENPLYDSFEIKVKDATIISETAAILEEYEEVEVLKYGEGLVERMLSVFNIIQTVAYGVLLALLLVTIFLITNTIKLTIYARQREIGIMRLVGASNFVIKFPFMIEGIVLGILGSLIPIGVTIYGYNYLYVNFDGNLISPLIKLVEPYPFSFVLAGALLGIGLLVGMVGSVNSVGKYLKL